MGQTLNFKFTFGVLKSIDNMSIILFKKKVSERGRTGWG